jgi:hypothetical protein
VRRVDALAVALACTIRARSFTVVGRVGGRPGVGERDVVDTDEIVAARPESETEA